MSVLNAESPFSMTVACSFLLLTKIITGGLLTSIYHILVSGCEPVAGPAGTFSFPQAHCVEGLWLPDGGRSAAREAVN